MLRFFSGQAFGKILTIMEEEDVHNAKKDAVTPQLMAKGKVAALGASFAVQMLNSSLAAAAMSVCEHFEVAETIRKRTGRYMCTGVLHHPKKCFWKIDFM